MRLRYSAAATVAAFLVIGALVVAGCGGDDDTSATTASLSKEEFLAQGNAICAEGNKTIEAAGEDLGQQPSQADFEAFVNDSLAPAVQGQIDGINALGAPEGDEEQVTAITDAAQEGVDEIKADPGAITGNQDPFEEANKLAGEYGLTECSG